MVVNPRRGGIISLSVNGVEMDVVDEATYNLGGPMAEALAGASRPHGYSVSHEVPFIEATIRDSNEFVLADQRSVVNATVVAELENGWTVTLRDGWAAGSWEATTKEGEISARWEGLSADRIRSN